jgi:hypothetical protein
VAKRDGAAARVQLRPVEPELVLAVDGHASKGDVDLDDVHVGEGEPVLRQQLGDGDGRSNAAPSRDVPLSTDATAE